MVETIFVDHRVPALPIVGGLDRRDRQVAQRAFVLGEPAGRNRRAGAYRGLPPYPVVDVVPDIKPLQPAEIADAGAAGKRDKAEQHRERRCELAAAVARRHRSCRRLAAPQASAPAAVCRRIRTRLLGGSIRVTLDADDRQNNDRRGFFGAAAAEAYDAPVVGKFDDVAHQPLSSDDRDGGTLDPAFGGVAPIKWHARLTLR